MSLLDEIVTKYGFDKLNTLTYYPSILNYHNIENNKATNKLSIANYQPIPPRPEQMQVVIKELIDGDIIRIIAIDNDFFVGNKTDIIHARGDRIILDNKIVPMYKALSPFFGANMTNNERLMVLYAVVYNEKSYMPLQQSFNKENALHSSNEDTLHCVLVEGFTLKIEDAISLCRDNSIEQIQEWVNTLHQPFWSINTLNKFCQACNIESLPVIEEMTLNQIPTSANDIKSWITKYKKSTLTFSKPEPEKPVEKNEPEPEFTKNMVNTKRNLDDIIQNTQSKDINNIGRASTNDNIDFLFTNNNEIKKEIFTPSKGIVIRSLDRSYIRKININNY